MKLKMPLFLIVAGGCIFSIVVYLIWYYTMLPYSHNVKNIVMVSITVLYLFLYFLILPIRSFQKPWKSFFLVSTITLLIFGLTISVYYVRSGLIKAQTKRYTEKKRMEELEVKIDAANKFITELIAKLESESKENDKLREQLNEIIRKTKGDDIVKGKLNRDSSEIKINSKVDNTDLDSIGQEIIFKVQIISSDTILAINSSKLKGLKNVWEYKDGGLYKYTVGNTKDLKSASVLQSGFRRKGFSGAFVVAFKNGKRIPLRDALKLLN